MLTAEQAGALYEKLLSAFTPEEEYLLSAVGQFFADSGMTHTEYGYKALRELFVDMDTVYGYLTVTKRSIKSGMLPVTLITLRAPKKGEVSATTVTDPSMRGRAPAANPDDGLIFRKNRAHMNDADLSALPRDISRATAYINPEKFGQLSEAFGVTYDYEQLNADYHRARRDSLVIYSPQRDQYFFPLSRLDKNMRLYVAALNHTPDRPLPWSVVYVGWDTQKMYTGEPKDQFKNWANLGVEREFLADLAANAMEERWEYDSHDAPYAILRNYITYTFYYLYRKNKRENVGILYAKDGSFAAFNTGLQYRYNGEDLFAVFRKQTRHNSGVAPWRFVGFCCQGHYDAGARSLYLSLTQEFKKLPQAAVYFHSIDDLLFDPNATVEPTAAHIGIDNCDRLPLSVLEDACGSSLEALTILARLKELPAGRSAGPLYASLRQFMSSSYAIGHKLEELIKGAVDRALARVRRNYRLAIPCYYTAYDSISLMLPISFSYDLASTRPDAVLICAKNADGNYCGRTILTLKQAYVDARLMCRPDSEWLTNAVLADPNSENLPPDEEKDGFEAETVYWFMHYASTVIREMQEKGSLEVVGCEAVKDDEGRSAVQVELVFRNPLTTDMTDGCEGISVYATNYRGSTRQENKPCFCKGGHLPAEVGEKLHIGEDLHWTLLVYPEDAEAPLEIQTFVAAGVHIDTIDEELVELPFDITVPLPESFVLDIPDDTTVRAYHQYPALDGWDWLPHAAEECDMRDHLLAFRTQHEVAFLGYWEQDDGQLLVKYRITNTGCEDENLRVDLELFGTADGKGLNGKEAYTNSWIPCGESAVYSWTLEPKGAKELDISLYAATYGWAFDGHPELYHTDPFDSRTIVL